MGMGMAVAMLMSVFITHVVLDLVVQHTVQSQTRSLVGFVTAMVLAGGVGIVHGVFFSRYGRKP